MICLPPVLFSPDPRRENAHSVSDIHGDGFVYRHEHGDFLPELPETERGIIPEISGDVPVEPAQFVLQFLRQIPVIQGHVGHDPAAPEFFEHAVIKIHPFAVNLSSPLGKDP